MSNLEKSHIFMAGYSVDVEKDTFDSKIKVVNASGKETEFNVPADVVDTLIDALKKVQDIAGALYSQKKERENVYGASIKLL